MYMDDTQDKSAWDFLTQHGVSASVSGQDTPCRGGNTWVKKQNSGDMGLFQFWKKSNKKIGRDFLDIQTFTLSQAQRRPMLLCQEQSKSHVLLEKAKSGHLEICTRAE